MATLWKSYPSTSSARDAVAVLKAGGVPSRHIRLVAGAPQHDLRDEPVGEFAGTAEPNDPVGTFGNTRRLRRQGTGGFAGDPDRQRQGCFGDADRELMVSHDAGSQHAHVTGDLEIRRLLREVAVEAATLERILDELHSGRVVVVTEIAPIGLDDALARLNAIAASAA